MSLDVGTPAARRRAMHEVPAAFRKVPPRVASTSKAACRPPASAPCPPMASTVDATRLFRHFEQQLPDGEHVFSQLRQNFAEWCREGDVTPPAANKLSSWLTQAGLMVSRRGRQKVTVFTKHAARLAA